MKKECSVITRLPRASISEIKRSCSVLIQKTRIPLWSAIVTTTTLCQQRGRQRVLLRTIIWKQCRFLLTEYSHRLTAPKRNYPNSPLIRPCLQKSIVSPMTVCVTLWVKWWLSIPSRSGMNISTPPISLYWQVFPISPRFASAMIN